MSNSNQQHQTKDRDAEVSLHSSPRNWDRVALSLTYKQVVEILYFIYMNGFLSYEFHDPIHDLKWQCEVLMDNFVPGWQVSDLEKLVKEARSDV